MLNTLPCSRCKRQVTIIWTARDGAQVCAQCIYEKEGHYPKGLKELAAERQPRTRR